jgi:hypothetical protein
MPAFDGGPGQTFAEMKIGVIERIDVGRVQNANATVEGKMNDRDGLFEGGPALRRQPQQAQPQRHVERPERPGETCIVDG